MSNVLQVSHQEAIRSLHEKGWSERRIARELGLHRRTVGRYVLAGAKCTTNSITGSEAVLDPKCTSISIAGSDGDPPKESGAKRPGPKSRCQEFEATISQKLEAGLSAQRIYQDLVEECGFVESYQSVQRFVRKLKETQPERVWRIECQPGEEMQVDFGLGAPIDSGDGKVRRSWVMRAVLSYSRKGYSEAVARQDTESFLRALENAVRHFGGSPLLLNIDNFKAAVLKADWYDPEINPKLAEFCRHYGMHVMPCRPRTPEHKGKVERGVGYVKDNGLKGHRFKSVAEENLHLQKWEATVADTRIHGTTCKQVAVSFEEERPYLQPLPASLFPCYQEARRSVNRDSFVEVKKAYYEAPPEYIGRQVWVRWDSRCLRIFNERMEQVAMHTRMEPGKFSRILGACGFSMPVRSSCRHWISRAAVLGDHCGQWAQAAVDARGPEALRSVMALCGLIRKHSATVLDEACEKALKSGTHRLKDIRRLIGEQTVQSNFSFAASHPLIRDLKTYSDFIHHNQTSNNDQYPQTTCTEPTPIRAA